jgi:hypothetical protein
MNKSKQIVLLFFLPLILIAAYNRVPWSELDPYINEASQKYNVEIDLIKTVIMIESDRKPSIVYGREDSKKKAIGPMQVTPATGKDIGFTATQLRDTRQNILAGTKNIARLQKMSYIGDNKSLILSGYNAGPYRNSIRSGKVPPIEETEGYVVKGKEYYEKTTGKDFGPIVFSRDQNSTDTNQSTGGQSSTSRKGYYPSAAALNYSNVISANSGNWCSKIKSASPKSNIILSDGSYSGGCSVRGKKELTISANSKFGVKWNGGGYMFEITESSYINIIGMEVSGGGSGPDGGIAKVRHHKTSLLSHHIYFGDCYVHDKNGGIYSGSATHDVTVDKSIFVNITVSYAWYCEGYHQVISNSLFYGINNNYVALRGYAPLGSEWDDSDRSHDARNNEFPTLQKDDWTHLVVNNTFGVGNPGG